MVLIEQIIAVAVFFQTIELLQLKPIWSNQGIWSFDVLKKEYQYAPAVIRILMESVLKERYFSFLLILRLLASMIVFFYPDPAVLLFLLASTLLISVRWRGTFNGGSDFMTLIVLSGLSVAALFKAHADIVKACLWYIALQSCSSYFVSGITKLKRKNWRTGAALTGFAKETIYETSALFLFLEKQPFMRLLISWFILIFELTFPLVLIIPALFPFYIGFAFVFHMANFYVFGLNRFLFAWVATYPAIYYCTSFKLQ